MPLLNDATDYDCRTCGEAFEPGDELVEVWGHAEVDDDGSWEGQDCDIHHASCVTVTDSRPPQYRLYETKRTGVTHLMEHGGIGMKSFCNNVDVDAGYEDLETVRAKDPERAIDDCCQTCAMLARRRQLRD